MTTTPARRATLLWVWLVWALALTEFGALADCPKVCECKWRDGKEVVACRDAHFIDIPRGLAPSTQVLDLRHNNLRILPRDSFVYTGLVNLQKVWLNFCNLMRLEKGAFRMLTNVVELDLSNNLLRSVPSDALVDMGGLRELRIAHNSLTVVPPGAFSPTSELVLLDVSHNSITLVEEGALRTLSRLEVLNLSENKLVTLDAGELMPLPALRVVHLYGNPWRCDCHLRPLGRWMRERNLVTSVPAACSRPRWLGGSDWQLLPEEEFVCAPLVTAVAPRVLAAEGENVSLACRVESEVEATVTWLAGDDGLLQNGSEARQQRYSVAEVAGPFRASQTSNLTISDVVPLDQGTYRCVAENRAGRREVNLTLQVSHEVAEVRVANVDDSYMRGGVLGGASILVGVSLVVCLLVYCKVRAGRTRRQDDDKLVTPQTSRGSEEADHHKLAGYHIVPTNDLEDPQPSGRRPQQTQSSWMLREAPANDFPAGRGVEKVVAEGQRQEGIQKPVAVPAATTTATTTPTPSSVSYVEIPKSGIGTARTTLEDPTRWKDHLVYPSRDALFYRMCGRSASQSSVGAGNGGQYPDLLDLPRSQLQQHPDMQQQRAAGLPIHTLNPSYCTLPRTRARVHSDASNRPEREANKNGGVQPHVHQPPQAQPDTSGYRSSSALNLALSEAASHAYAHLPSRGRHHPFPPTTPVMDAHDPQALHDLITAHRSQCTQPHDQEAASGGEDPYRFEYHAAQLEKFLQEYRCLQEQLIHMKQSYEAQHRRRSPPRMDCCAESLGAGVAPPPPPHMSVPPSAVEILPPPAEALPPPPPPLEVLSLPVATATPSGAPRPGTTTTTSSSAKSYGSGHQQYSEPPIKQPLAGVPAEPLKSILKKTPETGKRLQQQQQQQQQTRQQQKQRNTSASSSYRDDPAPARPSGDSCH